MGISPGERLTEGSAARCAESLFRHAPCEVILDRLAETSIGASAEEEGAPAAPGPPAGAGKAVPPRAEAPRQSV